MKYVVVLGDGMADYPVESLGNKTPLQAAVTPAIDYMAKHGILGLAKTVPAGMPPGSDTANLAVMGYNPAVYYSGRSPFEAASMGIPMKSTDITFRCNLVTLSEDEPYEEKTMLDHSADEITSEEARALILAISEKLGSEVFRFYPGFGYRHVLVWDKGPYDWRLIPPHDILEKKITDYMPAGSHSSVLERMMKESCSILIEHPVNKSRIARGLRPANSIWIWGEGKKPALSSFYDKYGLRGTVISAVDLIKGIGKCAGLESVEVPGATGNIHTNFKGKAEAALNALKRGQDFVYIHIEAPDECGHRHEVDNKVRSIELIDRQIIKPIMDELNRLGEDYRMLVVPDHPTPLVLRTHTSEPVPYLIFQSSDPKNHPMQTYDEASALKASSKNTSLYIEEGFRLMDRFLDTEKLQEVAS